MSAYKGVTCRGAYAFGSACGNCERCADDPLNPANATKPKACPHDTDGDGNCGQRHCPHCGASRVEPTHQKLGDPADRAASSAPTGPTEAQAADQFQSVVSRRAGYGDRWAMVYRIAKKGGTLAAGEGAMLVVRIEELEAEAERLSHRLSTAERDLAEARRKTDIYGPGEWRP